MTAIEKREIVSEVLQSLRTNSARIIDLTRVNSLPDDSYIELSEGRRIKLSDLKTIIQRHIMDEEVYPAILSILQDQQFDDMPLRMEIDTQGQDFLAYGESLLVTCRVKHVFFDVTSQVVRWEVTRDSGDAADDAAWKLRNKVMDFCGCNKDVGLEPGQIILCHERDPSLDDLGNRNVSTLFTFKAYMKDTGEGATEEDVVQFQLII